MKRAIFMAMLALSLTLGSVLTYAYPVDPIRTYAFPNSPCAPTLSPSTATSVSGVQVFLLLLPTLLTSIG